jgi:hypothetical protein
MYFVWQVEKQYLLEYRIGQDIDSIFSILLKQQHNDLKTKLRKYGRSTAKIEQDPASN